MFYDGHERTLKVQLSVCEWVNEVRLFLLGGGRGQNLTHFSMGYSNGGTHTLPKRGSPNYFFFWIFPIFWVSSAGLFSLSQTTTYVRTDFP